MLDEINRDRLIIEKVMKGINQKSIYAIMNVLFFAIVFNSCSDKAYTPKPRGFQRLEFPAKVYERYWIKDCHYEFDLPVYAQVEQDPNFKSHECWYNIQFPQFNATLHLSYLKVENRESLFKMINDSREMVFKHVVKADEIIENYISSPDKHGIFYNLQGNTATNTQFFVTDSTHHFLRGSLYFNAHTNIDSLAPALSFIDEDVHQLIKGLVWK